MEAQPNGARRRERVEIETDRHLIVGDVTLPPEGYQSRFSDVLNRADVGFLPVVNATIAPLGEGDTDHQEFIAVAKAHIRIAYPVEEGA